MRATLSESLREVVSALRVARSFEHGAASLLEILCGAADALLSSHGARSGRGIVHLRSEQGGYRALVTHECGGASPGPVVHSTTVWNCVERMRSAVAIDLGACRGITLGSEEDFEIAPLVVPHRASASVQQMIDREVTHVIALPLRAGAEIVGMACVELVWPRGVALPFPIGPWRVDLETLGDVAGPLLVSLPLTNVERVDDCGRDELLPVVGECMRPLVRVLEVFVDQTETLLLTGPTGSGKSRLAEWCHARGRRSSGPFETANLLAVPESMQMAELFGWKRGAFTGAHADHGGLLAASDGGTLFLDEIDKLTLAAQAGLLRVLETRRFSPLGATREQSVDVRFIVATNADLRQLVRRGEFREDLYYRVNVLPIRLAPLSDRRDEVPGWAAVMLARRHREASRETDACFSAVAIAHLAAYEWPGNLRQLDNVVRRAYALYLAQQGRFTNTNAEASATSSRTVTIVEADVVDRALAFETHDADPRGAPTTVDGFRDIARSIVERAIHARRTGTVLALDSLDVLRAAVIRAATERVGSLKDAYLLFGSDALVAGRNHTAAYKKQLSDLDSLERWLLETETLERAAQRG